MQREQLECRRTHFGLWSQITMADAMVGLDCHPEGNENYLSAKSLDVSAMIFTKRLVGEGTTYLKAQDAFYQTACV